MRRWTIGTAVLSLFALAATAADARAQVTVGPMAGASFFTFHGSDANAFEDLGTDASASTRVGFTGGAFAEFEFGSTFAVEPQLLYVQKGSKYDASVEGVDATASLKLDYIQVPVLLKAEFGRATGGIVPAIFAGPAIGFKVKCTVGVDAPVIGELSDDCPDGTVKGTEFSGIVGAGVEFRNWSLQGRYDFGFSSVAEQDFDVKNGGLLVTLGYGFRVR